MGGTQLPIGCRLDALSPDERQRQKVLRQELEPAIERIQEAENGYVFTYHHVAFRQLAEWLTLERRCCPFLDFELAWRADSPSPTLGLSSPDPAVKAFIADTFVPANR
jgi:hypothetical protein